MPKFTKVPTDTFKNLQINAGILVTDFTPGTGVYEKVLASTSGGISFASNPTYEDFGEDIDNCPKNSMELKRITAYDPTMSGTFLTINDEVCKILLGSSTSSTVETSKTQKYTPSMSLATSDFKTIWFVGDYSQDNSESGGGFVAIELLNALNTTGFQIQTTDRGKGQFAFELHGHASISTPDVVPFNVYINAGAANKPTGGA